MERLVPLFVILFILFTIGFVWSDSEPKIVDGTEVTASAVVTDRAMSDNMSYISVSFENGSGLCLWDPQDKVIPDGISIGDTVEVTYGKQNGFDHYVVLQVTQ